VVMSEFEKSLDEIEREINELIRMVNRTKGSDPKSAVIKARIACEAICREVCLRENLIDTEKKKSFSNLDLMITLISKHEIAPRNICVDMRILQWKGNTEAHEPKCQMPGHR